MGNWFPLAPFPEQKGPRPLGQAEADRVAELLDAAAGADIEALLYERRGKLINEFHQFCTEQILVLARNSLWRYAEHCRAERGEVRR